MKKDSPLPPAGHAEAGVYVPDAALQYALQSAHVISHDKEISQGGFQLAEWQSFIDPREQRAYDGLVGLLLDAGVSGELRDEYMYLGQELIGNLHSDGAVYALQMSSTSVQISSSAPKTINGHQIDVVFETGGVPLETHQVRDSFMQAQSQLRRARAWRDASLLSSNSRVRFGLVEVSRTSHLDPITMLVETRRGAWNIEVWLDKRFSYFRYAITDVERAVDVGWRVSDALLEDFAEAGGQSPHSRRVIEGMLKVVATVGP